METIVRNFEYRLYPTKAQITHLIGALHDCRHLYNKALELRIAAYQERKETLTSSKLYTMLVKGNKDYTGYAPAQSLVGTLDRLDKAYQRFFRERHGFPKFKSFERFASIPLPSNQTFKLDGNYFKVSKIGDLRIRLHRPIMGTPKSGVIKLQAGRWFVVLACEIPRDLLCDQRAVGKPIVGIDVGTHRVATLSDGTMVENERHLKKQEQHIIDMQKRLSRAQRGSKNRGKLKQRLAKLHYRVACARKDFNHKLSRQLAESYSVIVFEDLKLQNMVRRARPQKTKEGKWKPNTKHGLNRSILDVAIGDIHNKTIYKADETGAAVRFVDPRNTSQTCSECGHVLTNKLQLKDRVFVCPVCGARKDRDLNAALNIAAL